MDTHPKRAGLQAPYSIFLFTLVGIESDRMQKKALP